MFNFRNLFWSPLCTSLLLCGIEEYLIFIPYCFCDMLLLLHNIIWHLSLHGRELTSKSLGVKIENVDIDSSYKAEDQQMDEVNEDGNISNEDFGVTDAIGNEAFTGNSESPRQKDNNGCRITCLSNSCRPVKVDTFNAVTVHNHLKKTENSLDGDKDASTRSISNENIGDSSEYPKEKNNNGCQMACFSNSGNGPGTIDVGNSSLVCTQNEDKIKDTSNAVKINNHKKKKTASMDIYKDAATSGVKLTVRYIP